ncbi:MAG: ribosome-associated translation inhibitor RaiA [Chloroflexota bacterium]
MNVSVNGRNIQMTDRIQQYVEKKTARLDRYMPNLREIKVDLSETNSKNVQERKIAQITAIDKRGTILRAEERSNDLFASVDLVVDKLYKQIRKYRGKKQKHWRRNNMSEEFLGEPLPVEEDVEEVVDGNIVRTKRFALQPMSPQEAIDQIELLGHDFFVFHNIEENQINVLYKRRDADFGLLIPELN